MNQYLKRCWAEIDLDQLAENYRQLQKMAGAPVMAVVKANAYGHGDTRTALALQEQGAEWFGVSNLDEAVSLRQAGVVGNVLILGYTPEECASLLAEYDVLQTVHCMEYAIALNREAERIGTVLPVHIAIDTGMGRIGFLQNSERDAAEAVAAVCALPSLTVTGMFTHYSVADEQSEESRRYTQQQEQYFEMLLHSLKQRGINIPCLHTKNSAAMQTLSAGTFQLVRLGIVLFGAMPSPEVTGYRVKPVLQLKAAVSMVKTVPAGTSVSYGRQFITERETTIATVPVGYADGILRKYYGGGEVLVRGKRAPIIGNICMDQMMLDVTGIADVTLGDVVTLIGTDASETITVDKWAASAGTISYEFLCAIGHRVPRVYYRNGTIVSVENYLL